MPIKGLSEKRRFSRGGKIRLGEKRVSAKGAEYPSKLDYFLFDPEPENPSLVQQFHGLYGEKPTRLRICFPSDDQETIFPHYYKLYGASGLLCKGDGTSAGRVTDQGAIEEVDCPGPDECPYSLQRGHRGRPGCKRLASLQFFLPDLDVMQTWQIDTTSYNTILNMNSALDLLRSVAGRISFIPVDLLLRPQQATNPEDGKKIIIYVLDLVIPVGLSQVHELRPLIEHVKPCGRPSEALPNDLYPRNQIAGPTAALPEPASATTTEIADDDPPVDQETGEILDDDSWESASTDLPSCGLAAFDDPDVISALAGLTEADAQKMRNHAVSRNWNVEQVLSGIAEAKRRIAARVARDAETQTKPSPKPDARQRALF